MANRKKKTPSMSFVTVEQEANCVAFEQTVGAGFSIAEQHRAIVGDVLHNMVDFAQLHGQIKAYRDALSITTRGGRNG